MKNIIIRQLHSKDLKDFEKIYTETIQNEFPEYSQNIRNYFTDEYRKSMLKAQIKLGAFIDTNLVGFLIAEGKPFGGVLFVNWLAVLSQYQRKGVGKKLLQKIDHIAREQGAHTIHLEVSKRNIPFYNSCGYIEFGYDEKGYFGTDNYLMKKELREPNEKNFLKDFLPKNTSS